ncbi:adhesin/hemagglutinin [Yersinia enterocolitica]|nr:adhesin/hemagglutinin [Yersinia enterocolitica]
MQEQTSIFAGKGGFDITVGEHTQLDGAVIASTATADKNTLDTGTLGFSNIENKTDFKADHQGVVLSSGGPVGSDLLSNLGGIAPTGMSNDVHAKGTTQAAVSDGHITIPDTDKQQQNVTDLSRDVEHANNALSPIFDKEKEQNRLREINLIGDIGNQVADIARTQGKIAEEKALKDPKAIQAAKDALAENGNLTPTNKQLVEQIRNTASASYGTGSDLQRAIQAATAITQGLTGGNLGQALAGGSAPYLAHEISKYLPADQSLGANLIAHAVLGAVVGHFSGNATVGAVSAFTAEAAAPAIIKAMGWDKDSLTEKQKQTVSALATLAAGLAGGLVGDSSSSAVAGAQAGKNAVENNYLSAKQIDDFAARAKGCDARGDCNQIVKEMEGLSLKQRNELIVTCASDAAACKEKYGDIPANSMLVHEAIDRALGEDIPWSMKNDLSVLLLQQMDESGIVNSTEFAQKLQTIYGLDSQKAEILAAAAMTTVTGGAGKYQPNKGAVGNMNEFLKQPGFGNQIQDNSRKTNQMFQGQSVYQAKGDVGTYISKGDKYYLDVLHKNHIEVFDSNRNIKAVLNLDGTINQDKTNKAVVEGRKLPK